MLRTVWGEAMWAMMIRPFPSCIKASLGDTFGLPSGATVASQQSTLASIDCMTSIVIITILLVSLTVYTQVLELSVHGCLTPSNSPLVRATVYT